MRTSTPSGSSSPTAPCWTPTSWSSASGSTLAPTCASQLGLTVEPRGIVVDEHARTSDGLTVAAGDCAVGPNPFVRGLVGPTRLESVAHATDQARAAAATLAGRPAAYASVPWFWSDQGDLRLQIAGLPQGADQTVLRGDPAAERFSLLSYRDGLLIAIESVGSPSGLPRREESAREGYDDSGRFRGGPSVPLKRLITRGRDTRSP